MRRIMSDENPVRKGEKKTQKKNSGGQRESRGCWVDENYAHAQAHIIFVAKVDSRWLRLDGQMKPRDHQDHDCALVLRAREENSN